MDYNPSISKTIYLVRHGHYKKDPEKLTEIGIRQVELTAKALTVITMKAVYSSTMIRAQESAEIIAHGMPNGIVSRDFFCEVGLPGMTVSGPDKEKTKRRLERNLKQADKAFAFLFKAPKDGQESELLVAHGNIIRHFVCRALGVNAKKWVNMDVKQGSITTIRVDGKGNMMLLGFSEASHMPSELHTYI